MQLSRAVVLATLAVSLLFATILYSADESRTGGTDNREVLEADFDASLDEVWNAFTTTAGLKAWCAPVVDIDLRIGGKMRANYDPAGELGDANTIENTILSFDPRRMLSLKVTKPPAGFPFSNAIKEHWTVIYFQELAPDQTRLSIVGLGYTDSEESQQMRAFFIAGNNYQNQLLKEALEKPVKP